MSNERLAIAGAGIPAPLVAWDTVLFDVSSLSRIRVLPNPAISSTPGEVGAPMSKIAPGVACTASTGFEKWALFGVVPGCDAEVQRALNVMR